MSLDDALLTNSTPYYRGCGSNNFVIGFRSMDLSNYVLRFNRFSLSTILCENQLQYFNNILRPLFSNEFLPNMDLHHRQLQELKHLVSLHTGNFPEWLVTLIESWSERYHSSFNVPCIKMFDLTTHLNNCGHNNVYAVELKPKHGLVNHSPDLSPYCSNCLLQLAKSHRDKLFMSMYDFCPLDLYSKTRERVKRALKALLENPHSNLRLFKNGKPLPCPPDNKDFDTLLDVEFLADFLCDVLSGDDKILDQLAKAQSISALDPFQTQEVLNSYALIEPEVLTNPYSVLFDQSISANASVKEQYALLKVKHVLLRLLA